MNINNMTNLILFTQNDPERKINGNLKSTEWSDGSRIEYEYDSTDRLCKLTFIDADNKKEVYEYRYNKNGDVYCKNNNVITKVKR